MNVSFLVRGIQEVIAEWAHMASDLQRNEMRSLGPRIGRSIRSGSSSDQSLSGS